jgi:hypothetical protein
MIASTQASSITNIASADQERLVIVGATGMSVDTPFAARSRSCRRKCDRRWAQEGRHLACQVKEVLHQEFADCSALAETLSGQDAAVFCLGTYAGAVSDAELRTITVDYAIEFARVFRSSSPCAAFSFSSGNGTDPTGRSRLAFARYKGEAEKALLGAGFPRVSIFRPAYIYPRGAAEGTEFQLPAWARDLPRVLGAVPEPDDSGRRLGRSHGRCRCPRSRRAPSPGCREP